MLLSSCRQALDYQNNSNDFLFPLSENDADDETDPDRIVLVQREPDFQVVCDTPSRTEESLRERRATITPRLAAGVLSRQKLTPEMYIEAF